MPAGARSKLGLSNRLTAVEQLTEGRGGELEVVERVVVICVCEVVEVVDEVPCAILLVLLEETIDVVVVVIERELDELDVVL